MAMRWKLMLLPLAFAGSAGAAPLEGLDYLKRCEAEGKRLWGRSLCAPVVAVDPATGAYRTSREAPGPLPAMRANTAIDWQGERWIMVLDPLPKDSAALSSLLFHEAFHVHQEALGLPSRDAVAGHLDAWEARYLMRLEWKALAAALQVRGERRREHVAQALAFRARRLGGGGDAAARERAQMRHEGLAAYTGAALSGTPLGEALAQLDAGHRKPTLSRSFAYVGAPAWGLLLDALRPGWRRELGSGLDLPDMVPVKPAAIARADDYGGGAILAAEALADVERKKRREEVLRALAPERALMLPLAQMAMDFDPNRVGSAPDGSPLYEKIALRDAWGEIRVDGVPVRIAKDFKAAYARWPLTAPDALRLAPGWKVVERPGGGAQVVKVD